MPGTVKHPCQAVVVRYSPDPASGELLNIGVVLLSPGHRFMGARFLDSWARVTSAFPDADRVHLRRIATAIDGYCERYYDGTQLALQEPFSGIERAFDDVVPREDAALVRSAAISGVTSDPNRTLVELFERYVAVRDAREQRVRRSDEDVWRSVSAHLGAKNVLGRLQPRLVEGRHYQLQFEHAWQNGRWNVAKALSFDLLDAEAIGTKAANWTGRIYALDVDKDLEVHLIVGMPPADAPGEVKVAAEHAISILKDQLEATERAAIVREDSAEAFAERVAKEIQAHEAAE